MSKKATIIYTKTDEAPLLATYSFRPIVQAFASAAGIAVETRDISLAGRILALFSEYLEPQQRQNDDLQYLGELALKKEANIIKLPNISASVPQLLAAITELQDKGYAIPDYPEDPKTEEEQRIRLAYDKVKGSAVNPVLRQGNSDRRAPRAVKEYAKHHPHRMGAWTKDSRSHVSTMKGGDFFSNEKSHTMPAAGVLQIELHKKDGTVEVLKSGLSVLDGEIIDATFMSKKALVAFLEQEVKDAKEKGLLFSVHLKATMMKVSDPLIFGHAVRAYFKPLFEKWGSRFEELGLHPKHGFGAIVEKMKTLEASEYAAFQKDLDAAYLAGGDLAMVNSDKGITNLHVPSDVIIDASMPAMIRTSGMMWNKHGELQETKCVIPDASYAGVYAEVFQDCKENGAFDPSTMGSVSNVGLMAQKAEEYGSHDKTFEISAAGQVKVLNEKGEVLLSHEVEEGDIWRMCQAKDIPIRDWVKLAVNRARQAQQPAIFWLDEERAHDRELIKKVKRYLAEHDTKGLDIQILAPGDACKVSVARIRQGLDTISVTGNVLRDYLTDLFPILEVGTSAKMLSIVPLLAGGGLFETGAGGSAPKHVEQFTREGYLRWDSVGEFLALAASFEHIALNLGMEEAGILGEALDQASTQYLMNNKAPARRLGQIDNRGGHYYVALYWAEALAHSKHQGLSETFKPVYEALREAEKRINHELIEAQGKAQDLGGYYAPDDALAEKAMRPSATFNAIIDALRVD